MMKPKCLHLGNMFLVRCLCNMSRPSLSCSPSCYCLDPELVFHLIPYVPQKFFYKQIEILFITKEQLTDVNNCSETPPYIIMHQCVDTFPSAIFLGC